MACCGRALFVRGAHRTCASAHTHRRPMPNAPHAYRHGTAAQDCDFAFGPYEARRRQLRLLGRRRCFHERGWQHGAQRQAVQVCVWYSLSGAAGGPAVGCQSCKLSHGCTHVRATKSATRMSIRLRCTPSCREKYQNDLRPDITKGPWSYEEDYVLALAHSRLGNKCVHKSTLADIE